jgi:hypothetical protein
MPDNTHYRVPTLRCLIEDAEVLPLDTTASSTIVWLECRHVRGLVSSYIDLLPLSQPARRVAVDGPDGRRDIGFSPLSSESADSSQQLERGDCSCEEWGDGAFSVEELMDALTF